MFVPVWKYDINTSSPFALASCGWEEGGDCEDEIFTYKEVAALCFEEYRQSVALKLKRKYGEYFARQKGYVLSPELAGLEKLGVDKLLEVLRFFGYYRKNMKNSNVDIKLRRQALYDDIDEEFEKANTTDIKKKKALELIASLGVRKSPEKKSRPAAAGDAPAPDDAGDAPAPAPAPDDAPDADAPAPAPDDAGDDAPDADAPDADDAGGAKKSPENPPK